MIHDGRGTYAAVLRIERFRWLWLAILLSRCGEAIAQVAMPLLVYDITGSSSLLGFMFVLAFAPRIVLAPIAGLLADRYDRRRLMFQAALLRTAGALLLPFCDRVWQIGAIMLVISVGVAVAIPAELSALPQTVDQSLLVPALSLVQVTNSVTRIVGPAAGAALVGFVGFRPTFWTEAACFVGAAVALSRFHVPTVERAAGAILAGARREIVEGLRVVWRTPIVRGITAVESLWQVMSAALVIAGLVYCEETLDLGERSELVYGFLTATMSGGAVVGALLASRAERRLGRPLLMAVGYLGPLFVLPALGVPPLAVLFGCWFLFGFADAWAVIAFQAYLAESVPDELRGRVYATWNGAVYLAAILAFAVVGWVTARLGAPETIALSGLVVGVGGPLLLAATGALAAVRAPTARAVAADRA